MWLVFFFYAAGTNFPMDRYRSAAWMLGTTALKHKAPSELSHRNPAAAHGNREPKTNLCSPWKDKYILM